MKAKAAMEFRPFYERAADWLSERLGVPILGALVVSSIPSLFFFLLHYVCTVGLIFTTQESSFHAWSWMIGVMIFCASLFLYYATDTLKGLFLHIDIWQEPGRNSVYLQPLNKTLSDRNFIIAGAVFGCLNMLMGLWFGVPYAGLSSQISMFTGFFLVGFVCGVPAWGIYGVMVAINAITNEKQMLKPDFTAPDGCAGMRFLGTAFAKFSAVTLLMAVMISVYILWAGWANKGQTLVKVAIGTWVIWPYLLSTMVLAATSLQVKRLLEAYKLHKEKEFSDKLSEHRARLEQKDLGVEERSFIESAIEQLSKDRTLLHDVRIWPFGKADSINYGLVFIGNMLVTLKSFPKDLQELAMNVAAFF